LSRLSAQESRGPYAWMGGRELLSSVYVSIQRSVHSTPLRRTHALLHHHQPYDSWPACASDPSLSPCICCARVALIITFGCRPHAAARCFSSHQVTIGLQSKAQPRLPAVSSPKRSRYLGARGNSNSKSGAVAVLDKLLSLLGGVPE
jgi:hypothetical protein